MSNLTITGDVFVNDDTSTTERFTSVSFVMAQSLTGAAGLEAPLRFDIERPARKAMLDDLKGIATTFIARAPRRTMSGRIDAIVNDGAELCKFAWTERDRTNNNTYSESQFGFFRINEPTIRGHRERLQLVLYPVNRLRFVNSSTYLSDADYT